jgi:Protein of unknown function (DUF2905)
MSRVASLYGDYGQGLLASAVVLAIVAAAALGLAKLGVDQVPGTLSWKSDNVTVFIPIGVMLLMSIVGTIAVNMFPAAMTMRRTSLRVNVKGPACSQLAPS